MPAFLVISIVMLNDSEASIRRHIADMSIHY
jgi:hypothetical protein